jgi:antitoxin (DNA-binding transcriptional repressor) of toxin-antitoxin stability system
MKSRISATRAARTFSDLLSRVRYRGETFVIERGGEPVGRLVPATPAPCALAQLLRELPPPDPGYWKTLESITTDQPAPEVPVATLIDASVLIADERGRLDLDAVVAQEADEVSPRGGVHHARLCPSWGNMLGKVETIFRLSGGSPGFPASPSRSPP